MKKRSFFVIFAIILVVLGSVFSSNAAIEESVNFFPSSYEYDSNSLKVTGFFVNSDNVAVNAVRFLEINIYSGNQLVASQKNDIAVIEAIAILPGGATKYSFTIKNPTPGLNTDTFWSESKVTCSFGKIATWPSGKKVFYMGTIIEYDTPPTVISGRMMIPARFTFEKMGALVDWKADSRSVVVTRDSDTVILFVDKAMMMVNGKPVALEVPAQIINGRVLVPLRAIANALGANITYGSKNEAAVIFE